MEFHTHTLTHFGEDGKGKNYPTWPMPKLGQKRDKRTMEKKAIRKWREKRGLSRAKLAELMGTSEGQIVKLEGGERRLTTDWLERFSRALNVPVVDLIDVDTDDQNTGDQAGSASSEPMDWRILREIIITRFATNLHPAPWEEADTIYRLYQERLKSRHKFQ